MSVNIVLKDAFAADDQIQRTIGFSKGLTSLHITLAVIDTTPHI
jgi:hypothetical protein